jgi:hypothetical protein
MLIKVSLSEHDVQVMVMLVQYRESATKYQKSALPRGLHMPYRD